MPKSKNRKNIKALIKSKFVNFFRLVWINTWIFTFLFFGAVLIAAVWIWWQCVYHPRPSDSVMQKIETERENFDDMKQRTMEAITFLQEYRGNYNNSDKFGEQRELFVDFLDEKVIEKIKATEAIRLEEEAESEEFVEDGVDGEVGGVKEKVEENTSVDLKENISSED